MIINIGGLFGIAGLGILIYWGFYYFRRSTKRKSENAVPEITSSQPSQIVRSVIGVILKCLVIGFLIIFSYMSLPWVILYLGVALSPSPPKPEITYAEFPFSLEYEIDEQRFLVEDTLICMFDGVRINEMGKYTKWKERLASGNNRVTLLEVDDKEIFYPVGSAEYYMGEINPDKYEHVFPNAKVKEIFLEGYITRTVPADDLLSEYNLKLISWKYTQPIKNRFK